MKENERSLSKPVQVFLRYKVMPCVENAKPDYAVQMLYSPWDAPSCQEI